MTPGALAVLSAIVGELEGLAIPYVIGGSIASSLVGEPRATLDVDIAVAMRESDVEGLIATLRPDWYVSREAADDAVRRHTSFNVIHLQTMQKVDLFVLGDNILDREQLRRRQEVQLAKGLTVWIGAAENQVLRKLWWYRLGEETSERQWRDVIAILRVQAGRLDESYLDATARAADLINLLDRAKVAARS